MKRALTYTVLLAGMAACKEPYDAPGIRSTTSYLVVQGQINSGADSTVIFLSRTVSISSKITANPLAGATVAVEGDQGISYPLSETGMGRYVCASPTLDNAHKYRLDIRTGGGQYLSDFVPVLNSPPMDSVNYTIGSNSLTVLSNTHDATNQIQYYRWDYVETWIYHSRYDSYFVSNGDTVLARLPSQQVYTCWPSDTSSNIVLSSTARLSKAVIVNNPITTVFASSPKIADRYTIQVRQYALSADAYNYWQNLKHNTENLGTIFDAQPSEIKGNIHSVNNPSEPVIGYVSAGSVSSERIFIDNRDLPAWVVAPGPYCTLDSFYYKYTYPNTNVTVNQVDERINYNRGANFVEIPIQAIVDHPGFPPVGYSASTKACVDCTLYGTNKQPAFWK